MSLDYAGLFNALQPEAHLVLGALLVLGFDLIRARPQPANLPAPQSSRQAGRHHVSLALGLLALALAGWRAATTGNTGPVFGGVLMIDTLTVATRVGVISLAGLALCLLPPPSRLRHPAEFVAIVLFATTGFTLMAAANQLLRPTMPQPSHFVRHAIPPPLCEPNATHFLAQRASEGSSATLACASG